MHFLKVSICWVIVWLNCRILRVLTENSTKTWTDSLEYISPKGEIRPITWNPAFRNWTNESMLGHLDPKSEIQTPVGRIIGGQNTQVGQIPYQVAIFQYNQLWCGGTIYNKETVLSAGHCFRNGNTSRDKSEFVFLFGKTNIKDVEGTEVQRLASSIIVHPQYDPMNLIFDVSIIKLDSPLVYTDHIQPLPPGNPIEGGKATISGWGYTRVRPSGGAYDHAGYGSSLKSTEIRIFKKEECAELYGRIGVDLKELVEHKNYVCAGVREGGVDACAGDSGGPLACKNCMGSKSLCGIVSSGIGCGLPGQPGFYMNVTVFQNWIESHAGKPDKGKELDKRMRKMLKTK